MTRARSLSRLANSTVFTVSDTNRVGIGSTIPDVKLDVGGKAIIDDTTQTTSVSTGALVVSGGVGIGKSLFVGGDMSVAGTLTYEDVTNTETAGITTTGGLVVAGLGATFGSISTHFSNIEFGAAGVGGTITPLGHAEFVGVVTASSFSGDGSGLTGVASTDNINTSTLAQFTGGVGIADSIFHIGDDNTAIRFPASDTFTVETAGSERVRVDSSGRFLVGIDASQSVGFVHRLQVEGTDAGSSSISLLRNSNDSSSAQLNLAKTRGTSTGSNTVVQDDDSLGEIKFRGADGTDKATEGARITASVDGTPGSNDMPGRLTFHTRPDGADQSMQERLRITAAGDVGIGEPSPGNRLVVQKANASGDVAARIKNDTTTDGSESTPTTASLYLNTSTSDFNTFYIQARRYDNDTHFGYSNPRDSGHIPSMVITDARQIAIGTATIYANANCDDLIVGNRNNNEQGITIGSKNQGQLAFADLTGDRQGLVHYQHTDDSLRFMTNGASNERLRIASSGQIGLGGANYGTAGQVITSNGSGSAPTWQDASGGISTQAGTASGIITSMFLNDATDHKVTATGICTITTTQSGTEGQSHTIRIVNSGIATVGFSTYFLFPSGSSPVLPTADGAVSLISFTVHDSVGAGCTQLLAGASVNFS